MFRRKEESGGDILERAEKRIEEAPYDQEAWTILIRESQGKRIEDARKTYEKLVQVFPSCGKYWKLYIEHEMKARNYDKVEKLFQRCLMKVLAIDLWKTYLTYIKDTKGSLPSFREKMAQAYDFALDKVGLDIFSFSVWNDYINFLKSVEAVGSYAENQRITAVRKVYSRGVVNPMTNIEVLWTNYCAFENQINPLIAKKMQEDKGRDYMNARRVTKEYEAITKGLNRYAPATPPTCSDDEKKQVELWKKYISWERSNPLKTEDYALLTKRVVYAYEQCLLCLAHHPDIWIEAATFLDSSSKILAEKGDQNASKLFLDEAASFYERAISGCLKNNPLAYFAYADFEEGRAKHEKAHSIYKRLIGNEDMDPTLGYIQYMKYARRAEGIKSARQIFKLAREDARSKYQIFVAAAMMEYFCSKDKNVAFKIFELGLKKFGSVPEYIQCYADFMSHLNEDNNTRVLFERFLTSGQLEENKAFPIWTKFLEFEANVGDLASILKVEKRRAQAMGSEAEGKDTALLIDRYKYLDLLPCSSIELKVVGYQDLAKNQLLSMPLAETTKEVLTVERREEKPKFTMPDTSQMIPFKPQIAPAAGAHPVPGGSFPPPPLAGELLAKLPPPSSFEGPFVKLDKFIDHLMALDLSDAGILSSMNGMDAKSMDSGTQFSIDVALGRKRRLHDGKDDSDEEMDSSAPPSNDIYRARQQKKVK